MRESPYPIPAYTHTPPAVLLHRARLLGPGAQEGSPLRSLLALELSKARLSPNGKLTHYMERGNAALSELQSWLKPVVLAHGGSGLISKAGVHQYSREVRS